MMSIGKILPPLIVAICLGVPGGECTTCADDPCVHGTCVGIGANFSCNCDKSWEGETCNKGGFGAFRECVNGIDCSGKGNCTDFGTKRFCMCNEGYAGDSCTIECGPVDVGFILDGSGSVRKANWNRMIRLLNSLVESLPDGAVGANYGALEFSTNATVYFDLINGTSKTDVIDGLNAMPYATGYTDTPRGMDVAKSLFEVSNGDREFVNNVVLLITGGRATRFLGELTTSESPAIFQGKANELKQLAHVIAFGLKNAREDQMSWTASSSTEYTVKIPYTEIGEYLPIIKTLICKASGRCNDIIPCDGLLNRRCVDSPTGPSCLCAFGFDGPDCSHDINECDPAPCMNGGNCIDGVNGYNCSCAPGYEGERCEVDINECDPAPCMNGGNCIDGVNGYNCSCAPGYEGERCDVDINECDPAPCMNGGNCIDGVNGYNCSCAPGYEGERCDVDINDCEPNRCENGGSCEDLINDHKCTCVVGYTGTNCETAMRCLRTGSSSASSSSSSESGSKWFRKLKRNWGRKIKAGNKKNRRTNKH